MEASECIRSARPQEWINSLPEGSEKKDWNSKLETLLKIPPHDKAFDEHEINHVATAVVDLAWFVIEQQSAHETREKIARGE